MLSGWRKYWPWIVIPSAALWYSWDLIWLKRFLNHPEYVDYYPPYRHWFLSQLRTGHFPIWNPYWGLGHTSEIEASFPIDLYSLIEMVIGPRYHLILGLQAALILGAGFLALRIFGLRRPLCFLGAALFLLSPWVSYFYLYFIKASSLIGLWLSTAALYAYFKKPSLSRGLWLTAATIFTMLGTKLEFWFFHFVFLGLFSLFSFFIYRFPAQALARAGMFILLGIATQLWQIVPLWQILQESHRLENPPGFTSVFSGELYRNLAAASFRLSAIREFIQGLFSPFGLGALVAGIAIGWRRNPRQIFTVAGLFLPLAYYWVRAVPGDLNELTVLNQSPAVIRFIWGALAVGGALAVMKLRRARLAWALIVAVFLLRNQGQILLSYLFGIQWIPSRDNFLIDMAAAWLAVLGLSLFSRRQQIFAATLIPLILVATLWRNPFYMHPLMADVSKDYPRVEGDPKLSDIFQSLPPLQGQSVYFADPAASADLRMYGSALWTQTRQAHLFSSLVPRSFRQWSAFQWFGIPPEANWSAYEGEYSPLTISHLPFRNTHGLGTNRVYWHALHAMPPPNIHALRLTGVRYVLSQETLPEFEGFSFRDHRNGYAVYEVRDPLPPAFLLSADFNVNTLTPPSLPRSLYQPVVPRGEGEIYQLTIKQPSWLITQVLPHPFWHLRVNGVPHASETAFGLLRAVRLPPGRWSVQWHAKIPGFASAIWFSGAAMLCIVLLALWASLQPIAAFKLEIEYA